MEGQLWSREWNKELTDHSILHYVDRLVETPERDVTRSGNTDPKRGAQECRWIASQERGGKVVAVVLSTRFRARPFFKSSPVGKNNQAGFTTTLSPPPLPHLACHFLGKQVPSFDRYPFPTLSWQSKQKFSSPPSLQSSGTGHKSQKTEGPFTE